MRQARVLTDPEFKRVMAVVAQRKHAARDRFALILSHLAGLRVGEMAGLVLRDVFEASGEVREQLRFVPGSPRTDISVLCYPLQFLR